ncbi:MAG: class I SAM-dependent methyltransferase [Bryobacteraceae bacterium]|jgi:arsenite methyltransferase|nr:class I SAM-dependent methyltransferase [Bryobacteraceae bacterium]
MKSRLWLALAVVAALAARAQQPHDHPPRTSDDYVRFLENPQRDQWQKPDQVIQALGFRPGESVADIGAGTGYFSRRFARHAAKVYAVDIDASLLERARKNAPPNVEFVLAAPDDPKLPERSVDIIFFCNVLHHIENRPAYYAKLKRALKPGGRIVNIDFHKRPLPVGPPVDHKLSEDQVVAEFKSAGFELARSFDFLPYQYFLVFELKTQDGASQR